MVDHRRLDVVLLEHLEHPPRRVHPRHAGGNLQKSHVRPHILQGGELLVRLGAVDKDGKVVTGPLDLPRALEGIRGDLKLHNWDGSLKRCGLEGLGRGHDIHADLLEPAERPAASASEALGGHT